MHGIGDGAAGTERGPSHAGGARVRSMLAAGFRTAEACGKRGAKHGTNARGARVPDASRIASDCGTHRPPYVVSRRSLGGGGDPHECSSRMRCAKVGRLRQPCRGSTSPAARESGDLHQRSRCDDRRGCSDMLPANEPHCLANHLPPGEQPRECPQLPREQPRAVTGLNTPVNGPVNRVASGPVRSPVRNPLEAGDVHGAVHEAAHGPSGMPGPSTGPCSAYPRGHSRNPEAIHHAVWFKINITKVDIPNMKLFRTDILKSMI
eukprot:gene13820-biopygen8682